MFTPYQFHCLENGRSELPHDVNHRQEAKILKSKLDFVRWDDRTYLVVIAVDKCARNNSLLKVSSHRGVPIGGYIHDNVNDCYIVKGVNYRYLGYINVSFRMEMKEAANWSCPVPVPGAVIRRYLSIDQIIDLNEFCSLYSPEDYNYQFLQMLSTN